MFLNSIPILIFSLSLLTQICQGQEPPCTKLTKPIITPSPPQFWSLNNVNFEIILGIIPKNCIYAYVMTAIEIELGAGVVDIRDYFIRYRINNTRRSALLSALRVSSNGSGEAMQYTINPITVEEISISRFINSSESISVRYTISGYSTPSVTVLSYQLNQTDGVINKDDTYTGICNGEVCYGGRGQLMDGIIGNDTITYEDPLNVMWSCSTVGSNCTFKLKILLTRPVKVSHIVLFGYRLVDRFTSPDLILTQPCVSSNPVLNETGDFTYSIKKPVNFLTDILHLNMEIPGGYSLVLSEIEVYSHGINIALVGIENPVSNTEQLSCRMTELLSMVYPVLIGVLLLVQVVLFLCCLYQLFEKRKYKQIGKQSSKQDLTNNNNIHGNLIDEKQLSLQFKHNMQPTPIPETANDISPEYIYNELAEYATVDAVTTNPFLAPSKSYDYTPMQAPKDPSANYEITDDM